MRTESRLESKQLLPLTATCCGLFIAFCLLGTATETMAEESAATYPPAVAKKLLKGDEALAAGELDRAVKAYSQALQRSDDRSIEARLGLARAYLAREEFREVRRQTAPLFRSSQVTEAQMIEVQTIEGAALEGIRGALPQPPQLPPPPERPEGFVEPIVIRNPNDRGPRYTERARRAEIKGVVVLELSIDETGTVQDVAVLHGLSWGLDESAVDWAQQLKFHPALLHDEPVATEFRMDVRFDIANFS